MAAPCAVRPHRRVALDGYRAGDGANWDANQRLVQRLSEVATALGTTTPAAAIGWAMTKLRQLGLAAVTLVGARTRVQLDQALAACTLPLSDEATARIEAAVPAGSAAGARYAPAAMAQLDSERPATRA